MFFVRTDSLPDDARLAEVREEPNNEWVVMTDFAEQKIPTNLPVEYPSIDQTLEMMPDNMKWALKELKHDDNGSDFALAIEQGDAVVVSDGSHDKGRTTAGLVATRQSGVLHLMSAVNKVGGTIKHQHAFRGELSGIFGALVLIELICIHHKVTKGKVLIGLDGELARSQVDQGDLLRDTTPLEDLIQSIRSKSATIQKKFGIEIDLEWVEGHQRESMAKCCILDI